MSDPLGETLHLLRLEGSLYCQSHLGAPWGIDLPPLDGCMMFHVVTRGRCRLEVDGASPHVLSQGRLALVPHGAGHCIRSAAGVAATPLFDIPVQRVSERYEILRLDGGGERTDLVCGVVRFDHVAAEQLLEVLPEIIEVDVWDDDDGWLQATLRVLAREARAPRPGGETVMTRLADVLVIHMIRAWIDASPGAESGWLAALRDEQVGRALARIHNEPERPWTLASLAEVAFMSRSAFAAKFARLVGDSAMHYLTRWRLQLARRRLQETADPISAIAEGLGYHSDAAFCRAFKREFGVAPGSVRKAGKASQRDGRLR